LTIVILGLAGAALLAVLLTRRYWDGLNSRDMGTMSQQWLAEHNAQHP
jgi:hypothetical protein